MTSKYYDLYGSSVLTLEELRAAVEGVLDARFQRHESDYLGGEYFLGGDLGGEHLVIKRNADDGYEEEIAEPEFAGYRVLLEVNATTRGDEVKERLTAISGLDFLRRSTP